MNTIFETPVLEDKTSTGKAKFWQGIVLTDAVDFYTASRHWQQGSKPQQSAASVVAGKNLGKKNETSPKDQAIAEVKSAQANKEKKGYVAEGQQSTRVLTLPMLAHNYMKRPHDIVFPCDGQDKLDGLRCVTDGNQFWSREGNLFPIENLTHLVGNTGGTELDGELMLPGRFGYDFEFEDIISAVKDKGSPRARELEYRVFDCIDPAAPWQTRRQWLRGFFKLPHPKNWLLVDTFEVASPVDALRLLDECLARGSEGLMLRNRAAPYKIKHRSKDLQKFKIEVDEEFKIVGYAEGQGKDAGTPIWLCVQEEGKEFSVRPKGSLAYRQQLWRDRDKVVGAGAWTTVIYQNRTAANIPRFPRAKALRDYE